MSVHATKELQAYWKENLVIIAVHLAIWFFVSFFCGIMIVDQLDQHHDRGFPVGFWFANQGSIIIFVILIYHLCVHDEQRLDIKYDVHEG
jgi:putative solute:sodium symporter small subunit